MDGCSLFIYSIAIVLYDFKDMNTVSIITQKSTSEGVLVQFFGKGNTIMGRMIMCQMAIHLTVMIIVDVCVGMVGVK